MLPLPRYWRKSSRDDNSATSRALRLPEILEKILCEAAAPTPRYTLARVHIWEINKLRRVCRTWQALIDTSPSLSTLAFRNPRLCNPDELPVLYDFYLDLLELRMCELGEIGKQPDSKGFSNFKAFQKTFTKNGSLSWDLFVTQPASPEIYLLFSGHCSEDWLAKASVFTEKRPQDKVMVERNEKVWFNYQHKIQNADGVRCKDIFQETISMLDSFYSFPGEFLIGRVSIDIKEPSLEQLYYHNLSEQGPHLDHHVLWDRRWYRQRRRSYGILDHVGFILLSPILLIGLGVQTLIEYAERK